MDVAMLGWDLLEYPRTTAALHIDSTCKKSLAPLLVRSSWYASQFFSAASPLAEQIILNP